MALETILRLICGILLVGANAFFVATEFALTRVRQFPESDFADHPGLRRAWKMTDELEIYLTGCQVGITLSSILLGIIVEPAVTSSLAPLLTLFGLSESAAHGIGLVVGIVLINLVHTIWAEQTPTYLGIEKAKLVVRYCATPHYWWTRLVYPLLLVGDAMAKGTLSIFGIKMSRSWLDAETEPATNKKVRSLDSDASRKTVGTEDPVPTRGQLIEQMGTLLQQTKMRVDQRDEVIQTIRIAEITTEQIMVPRSKINELKTSDSFNELVQTIGQSKHTRYPLVGDDLDDFRGIVYLPELVAHWESIQHGSLSLEQIAASPLTVKHDLPVSDLIDRFQEAHHELALVVQQSFVVGLVTLTDAVEKIIGQVEDPLDLELRKNSQASTQALN